LRAARTTHDVITTELHSGSAKSCHLDFDVCNLQLDAIPTAGYRLRPVGHGSPPGVFFTAEQQSQIAPSDRSEGRGRIYIKSEAEIVRVKGDSGVHIINHVTNADRCCRCISHGSLLGGFGSVWDSVGSNQRQAAEADADGNENRPVALLRGPRDWIPPARMHRAQSRRQGPETTAPENRLQ